MTREPRWLFWTYEDAHGEPRFQHYRVSTDDSRGKRFGYRYLIEGAGVTGPAVWDYHKPEGADELLYRLPDVLGNPHTDLWSSEGERDCDEFVTAGVLATSHHGGAGKFSEAQAESLRAHRGRILLVADVDPAGAFDVVRRYDRLREVGQRPIVLAPPRPFNDAREALEAGRSLSAFRFVDVGRVREVAEQHASGNGAGSWGLTDDERAELPDLIARMRAGTWAKPAQKGS